MPQLSIRDLWMRVQEPRVVTTIQTLEYLVLTILSGAATLIHPPQSITAAIGPGAMLTVGIMMLVGGTIAVAGTPGGYWWLEKIGITALLGGASVYLSTVIYLDITGSGSRLMQISFIIVVILALLKRAVRIWPLEFDPEKDARRLPIQK